jgi:PilZ domain-containing protein
MASVHVPTINNLISPSPRWSFAQRDRRQHHRFPISAQAEYILDGHRANATMLDISRGGVLLKAGAFLQIGQKIVVLIDWPVLLDDQYPIRLAVFGKVLRSNEAGTAVVMTRYEFRTRGQSRIRLLA